MYTGIGVLGAILIALMIIKIVKIVQYKKHLGINLNFFITFIQIAKIHKWLKTIRPKTKPTFEAYLYVFAQTSFDNYTILNPQNFRTNIYGNIRFTGDPISFKEFSKKVEIFLNKPKQSVITHKDLKDISKFFKNYRLPSYYEIDKYTTSAPTKTNNQVYARLKIMALTDAYVEAIEQNSEDDKVFLLKELKKTYNVHKEEFSALEKKIISSKCTNEDLESYKPLIEGMYALCYVSGVNNKILLPNEHCTLDLYDELIRVNPNEFSVSKEKAIDLVNLYYALYYAIKDCKLKDKEIDLNEQIVSQRFHALIWLFDSNNVDYNDVECVAKLPE